MCRMLGVMCNDGELLRCAVHQVKDALVCHDGGSHDGIGVGYYNNEEPLLIKRPSANLSEIDHAELLQGITSQVVLLHVRLATVGGWKDSNTHPFRFRKWLFAHVGHLPALDERRRELFERLPPFLVRNIHGETDSELAFHLFLDLLFREGKLNELDLTADILGEMLREFVSEVNSLHQGPDKPELAVMVTNGRIMGAISQRVAVHYSHREGILGCPLHDDSQQSNKLHANFRGVMVGAAMEKPGHQWREIPDGSLLYIANNLEMKVHQL